MEDKDLNILIVEDDWLNANFLKDILITLDYKNIHIVSNNNDAVDIVKNHQIDLTLMDINIEDKIDGIQCAQILNTYYSIPIIYITAYSDKNTLQNASYTNIYGYILKPFVKKDIELALLLYYKHNSNKKQDSFEKVNLDLISLNNSYKFNKQTLILTQNNIEIKLTKKDRLILKLLCDKLDTYVSYEELKLGVWYDINTENSVIRDAITRLRKKTPQLVIENYSRLGYKILID